jgi:hypothetical protein
MSNKDLLEKAVRDAKQLKEAAMKSATNTLLEAISPTIERKVAQELGEDLALEMPMYEVEEEEPEMEVPEMEEAAAPEDDEEMMEAKEEDEEEVCEAKEEDEEEAMEEVVNVTQEDLQAALSEIAEAFKLSEANVTSGFGDVEDPNDVDGPGERGLEDKEKENKNWNDEEAPAAKDWTVKEAKYRKLVKQLQQENAQYKKVVRKLHETVKDVNLFNSKLLHTNKLLQSARLTKEQRVSIIEAVDKAQTLREVELVYSSLSESFKIAGVVLKESAKSKKAKASRYVPASSTVLKENVQRDSGDDIWDRASILAGLTE